MAVLGITSLTGCDSIPDFIPTGTLMLFQQSSAPPAWTKETTHDNKALRVVTGPASFGGSVGFTTVFVSKTPAGTVSGSNTGGAVANTTLLVTNLPNHNHQYVRYDNITSTINGTGSATGYWQNALNPSTGGAGSDVAHGHTFTQPTWSGTFTGTALNFAVQYVDLIIAKKN